MKEQTKQKKQKEYDLQSYSWANRCLLISLGLIALSLTGVPLVHIVGIVMLLGSLILYTEVSVARSKASTKAIPLDSKISTIKLGFKSINHISLTDEDMHNLPNNELKRYYKAGVKAMKGKR